MIDARRILIFSLALICIFRMSAIGHADEAKKTSLPDTTLVGAVDSTAALNTADSNRQTANDAMTNGDKNERKKKIESVFSFVIEGGLVLVVLLAAFVAIFPHIGHM